MGLFDNPLGFLFGEEGEQGAIDRRMNREPEGQRWWERWEQTFGQNGPMDPMNVYPRAMSALETLMSQYFPGWGSQTFTAPLGPGQNGGNQKFTAPLGPGPSGGISNIKQGNNSNWQGQPVNIMPGLLDMEQGANGVWDAGKTMTDGGYDPTDGTRSEMVKRLMEAPAMQSRDVPTYEFSPDELTAGMASGGQQNMMYRIKKPGEPGYDPVRDRVTDADMSGFKTMPAGGVAMAPAQLNGGTATPGLLEPLTLTVNGKQLPLVTKYDQTRNDLALKYVMALTGMMDPWMQGGMELERGRYGSPYQTPGSNGLIGGAINSVASGFGKGVGLGAGDYLGGKLFG